jgi:hypothetical protein
MQKKVKEAATKKMEKVIQEAKEEEEAEAAAERMRLELKERQRTEGDVPSSIKKAPKLAASGSGDAAGADTPVEFQRVVSDTPSLTDLHFRKRSHPIVAASLPDAGGIGLTESAAPAGVQHAGDVDTKKEKLSTSSPANTILADHEVATSQKREDDKKIRVPGDLPHQGLGQLDNRQQGDWLRTVSSVPAIPGVQQSRPRGDTVHWRQY